MKVEIKFTLEQDCDGMDYKSDMTLEHNEIKAVTIITDEIKLVLEGDQAQAYKMIHKKWQPVWENLPELRDAIIKLGKHVDIEKSRKPRVEFWNGYNSALHDMLKLLNGTLSI